MPLPNSAFAIFNLPPGRRSIELCGSSWLSNNKREKQKIWKSVNFPARCKSWHCHHCGQRHRNKLKKLLLELTARLKMTVLFFGFIDNCSLDTARRTVNRAKGVYFSAALENNRRLFITTIDPREKRAMSQLTYWAEVDHSGIEQLVETALQPDNLAPFGNRKKKNGIVTHSRNFGGTFYKPKVKGEKCMSEELNFAIVDDDAHHLTAAIMEEVLQEAGATKRSSEEVDGDTVVNGEEVDPKLIIELLRRRGFTVHVLSKSSSTIRTNNGSKGGIGQNGNARGGVASGP